jgi:hypothetical protein
MRERLKGVFRDYSRQYEDKRVTGVSKSSGELLGMLNKSPILIKLSNKE